MKTLHPNALTRLAIAVALCTFGAYGTASASSLPAQATVAVASSNISIVASNWKFSPETITVHENVATTLHLTSTEGVHGIQSADLGIPSTTLLPGKTVTVTFTPKKLGTYQVHCAIFCGAGHATMMLIVKVVP